MKKTFQRYHKHSSYSNPYTKDSPLVVRDYLDFFKKEGGKHIYSTVEHGYQSPYFRIYDEIEQYNAENGTDIKFVFGAEAYWVKNRYEKDNSNCHLILLAKNDKARKSINKAISIANKTGYYYKPRLDLELILSLPKDDVFVTTACIGYWNKYDDIDEITLKLNDHFTDFFLEIQAHDTPQQIELNKHILELSKKHNIPLIAGTDTHIFTETHMLDRDDLLKSSNISYEEESGWFMDMPTYDEFFERFRKQNIFTDEEIEQAIDNTNLTLEFEDIVLDRSLKIPTLYPNMSQNEKDKIFIQTIHRLWQEESKRIPEVKHTEYKEQIIKEINEIIGCSMCDYFLTNKRIIEDGINNEGGELTQSGRGSNVAMYLNKLLGFTNIDCIAAPIDMYSERFLTKERVLDSKTPPDEDFNVSDREPFIKAQRKLLGENCCYDLIAFGTLKLKSAFKMYARANEVDPQVANEVSKQIDKYEKALLYAEEDEKEDIDVYDYIDRNEFGHIIEGCQRYLGIIDNRKGHPCFTKNELVMTSNGYKKISDIAIGDNVMTHTNTFNRVVGTMKNMSDDIYEVKIGGSPNIEATGNHPFFVGRRRKAKAKKDLIYSWKAVEELEKGDMIGSCINQNSLIPTKYNLPMNNGDFWWIIGRFIGDGWWEEFQRKSGTKKGQIIRKVTICCNKNNSETLDITNKLDGMFEYRVNEERTVNKITINSKELHSFVKTLGKYANGKKLTNDIFDLPKNLLEQFIEGYISADGNINGKIFSITTISRELALGIISCVNKVYNMPCGFTIKRKAEQMKIEGRLVNCKETYMIRFKKKEDKKDKSFYKDGYIWNPFYSAKKLGKEEYVYNFEVENDHSYTINNLIVHNCGSVISSCDIEEEIGIVLCKSETTGKEVLTALIESITIDSFGWLKNDFLIVDSTRIINAVYKRIGIKPIEVNDLLKIIEKDEKVWDIYSNGITMSINQIEKEKTTQKMTKFKAKNIVELTQFIAAIRPSFKSLYSKFENREKFEYGIKVLDDLLQNQYCHSSFILFQEDLMKILNFAGFPMKDTYTIIKAISKKKKKVIAKVKPKFINNFKEKIIESGEAHNTEEATNLAEKIWGIVEDFSSYGFNSPHGFSYAIDSVTQAWQKANYPYEFYETVLRRFTEKGEKDRVSLLKQEMKYFNINLKPIKFRDDNRDFTANKNEGYITQPLNSIKSISKNTPQLLYDIKDLKANTFTDFLLYITDNSIKIDKTNMEILIKLDYFSEFGTINNLLSIYSLFKKEYNKDRTDKTKQKKIALIREHESNVDIDTNILSKIKYQIECIGYSDITTSDFGSTLSIITNIELNQYGTPFFTLYNIGSGKTVKIKVLKWYYNKKPISKNDFVEIIEVKNDKKMWIKDRDEYELVLHSYRRVIND